MKYTDKYGNDYELMFVKGMYVAGELAIVVYCDDGEGWGWEPYADLTVHLPYPIFEPDCAFLDTNNCGHLVNAMIDEGLVTLTGREGVSGFCTYPEGRFDSEWLDSLEVA